MGKTILGFILVIAFGLSVQAQKLGYVNLEALKSQMPEVTRAESDLKLYRSLLFEQGIAMVKELQSDYARAQRLTAGGCQSPRDQHNLIIKLQIKQNEIEIFAVRMEEMIQAMEAKLMNPILNKIDNAVQAVAIENQFQYILQKGSTAILYNDDTSDVSALVRGKLGM